MRSGESDHRPLAQWFRSAHLQHMDALRSRTGSIDWVDLSTPDADAVCAFYAKVLGWTFERSETPMGAYHVASAGGHQAGGVMAGGPPNGAPPMWTVFVRVSDIDETIGAITNANGAVLAEPFDIPGGARVAVVVDPTGAVFSLIAGGPAPEEGEPPLMRPVAGAVGWCEVLTRDPHTAVSFYDAAFGWQAHLDGPSGYTTFRLGDTDVAGILPMPAEVPAEAPAHWLVYFNAPDIDATLRAVVEAGGSVMKPATTVGSVTFALAADPAHAMFGLFALAPTG
jgi:predicted enzyme related to lactoylglutathione lyase